MSSESLPLVLPTHPALTIFPMMNMAELKSLAATMKASASAYGPGGLEPVQLHQGMVIDGRSRLKACHIAGVEPRFVNVELGNLLPVQYVIQQNIGRHKVTKSQICAIGALAADLLRTDMLLLKRQGKPMPIQPGEYLRSTVAKSLGISSKNVQDGINIRKQNPELFHRLWAGEISLLAALGKLETTGAQRYAERLGNCQKQKMIDILSRVRGLCRGLHEIDLTLVEMDGVDRKAWLCVISQTTQELRTFGQRLRKEIHHEASQHQVEDHKDRSTALPDSSACSEGSDSIKTEKTDCGT